MRLDGRAIDTILLDLDDTILDERPGRVAGVEAGVGAILEAIPDLDREGVSRRMEEASRRFWSAPEQALPGRLDMFASRVRIHESLLEEIGVSDPLLALRSTEAYWKARDAVLSPYPGAIDALERLRSAARRMALVTNGAGPAQRAKVERFDLSRWFDHIQIEGEFGAGKPDIAVFHHALGRLGARPESAVMAGDNFEIDVLGALDAGIAAVWIDKNGAGEPPAAGSRVHGVVHSIASLPDLLSAEVDG